MNQPTQDISVQNVSKSSVPKKKLEKSIDTLTKYLTYHLVINDSLRTQIRTELKEAISMILDYVTSTSISDISDNEQTCDEGNYFSQFQTLEIDQNLKNDVFTRYKRLIEKYEETVQLKIADKKEVISMLAIYQLVKNIQFKTIKQAIMLAAFENYDPQDLVNSLKELDKPFNKEASKTWQ